MVRLLVLRLPKGASRADALAIAKEIIGEKEKLQV